MAKSWVFRRPGSNHVVFLQRQVGTVGFIPPTISVQGSCAITATSSLVGVSSKLVSGSCSFRGSSAAVAKAVEVVSGSLTTRGSSAAVAKASKVVSGTVALQGSSVAVAKAAVSAGNAVALQGSSAAVAKAARIVSGAAVSHGNTQLALASSRKTRGTASVTGTGALATAASKAVYGTWSVRTGVRIGFSGSVQRSAVTSVYGSSTAISVGVKLVGGKSPLAGTGISVGYAQKLVSSSCAIKGSSSAVALAAPATATNIASLIGSSATAVSSTKIAAAKVNISGRSRFSVASSIVRASASKIFGLSNTAVVATTKVTGSVFVNGVSKVDALGSKRMSSACAIQAYSTSALQSSKILASAASILSAATAICKGSTLVSSSVTIQGIGTFVGFAPLPGAVTGTCAIHGSALTSLLSERLSDCISTDTELDTDFAIVSTELLTSFGRLYSLVIPGSAVQDPTLGRVTIGAETRDTIKASPLLDANRFLLSGITTFRGEAQIIVDATDLTNIPAIGYKVEHDSVVWSIIGVFPIWSGNLIAVYILDLRGGYLLDATGLTSVTELDDEFPGDTEDLLEEFGKTVKFKVAGAITQDPDTGRVTEGAITEYCEKAVLTRNRFKMRTGDNTEEGSLKILLKNNNLVWTPAKGIELEYDGESYDIIGCKAVWSGGLIALWILDVSQ